MRITKKRFLKSIKEITIVTLSLLLLFFVISFFMGLFNPLTLTRYVMTDGNKVLIFQEMRHIAQGSFYKKIDEETIFYREAGYTLMYEGIFSFNSPLNYKDLKVNYVDGIMEQPVLLGGYNDKDINLDFNWFEIVNKIQIKIEKENLEQKNNKNHIPQKLDDLPIIKAQKESDSVDMVEYTKRKLYSIRFVENLKNKYNIDITSILYDNNKIEDDVLITERNKHIFEEIEKSKSKQILIHYGADHFEGVYKLLENSHKDWRIIDEQVSNAL